MSKRTVQPLQAPLMIKEIKLRSARTKDGFISGVVQVTLEEFIHSGGLEPALDLLSRRLTGTDNLSDFSYKVVGHKGNTLFIRVTGDPAIILDCEES